MTHLTYRDLRLSDLRRLSEIVSDWQVVRQLGSWPWPPEPNFTKGRCGPYPHDDGFVWAVCEQDVLVATIAVTGGDLGYMVHPQAQGRGVMGQAARRAVAEAFAASDIDHLTALTWADNAASDRLLTQLGFEHWQTRYEPSIARGAPTLSRHYRLDRAVWNRARP